MVPKSERTPAGDGQGGKEIPWLTSEADDGGNKEVFPLNEAFVAENSAIT